MTVPTGIAEHFGDFGIGKLLDVAQPDRLAEGLGQRIERRLQVGAHRFAQQVLFGRGGRVGRRRQVDAIAVDLDRIAADVAPAVAERVVENREQPRLEVGARLELLRAT